MEVLDSNLSQEVRGMEPLPVWKKSYPFVETTSCIEEHLVISISCLVMYFNKVRYSKSYATW